MLIECPTCHSPADMAMSQMLGRYAASKRELRQRRAAAELADPFHR